MKRLIPTTVALLALAIGGCVGAGPDGAIDNVSGEVKGGAAEKGAGTTKVAVCHIPPGNPANAHTIVVGQPAVAAHLAHGDSLGACASSSCVTLGDDCSATGCCGPLLCVAGTCVRGDESSCTLYDFECSVNSDCCPGLICLAGAGICCPDANDPTCRCPIGNPACDYTGP